MSRKDANPANLNLWTRPEHALEYLRRADRIPHRTEGEATLLEFLPARLDRFLDLGCGDGRLLDLVKLAHPEAQAVAVDFSPVMLAKVRERFGHTPNVDIVEHDLERPLPDLGRFDAVVSSFAIHHLAHERKRELYSEVYGILHPGGIFCNLEHVSSPSQALHDAFYRALGSNSSEEDPSNQLLNMEVQLEWLRELGFVDVDCQWKWRELALLTGCSLLHPVKEVRAEVSLSELAIGQDTLMERD